MYTVLVNDDNTLVASVRERIMQRSKLVDSLQFIVPQLYKDTYDMGEFTAVLEYILPVSKKYITEQLVLNSEMYKDTYYTYTVPFDTQLTTEAGDIEIQLSFIRADLDADGNAIQLVRKTSPLKITIIPIAAWADIIPDDALTAIDKAFVALETKIKELQDAAEIYDKTKLDSLGINDDGELQGKSSGSFTGDSVNVSIPAIEDDEDSSQDGIVNLDNIYNI